MKNKIINNSLWNFFGQVIPILIGILIIPKLINSLGTERFGILSIIWMSIGYFSLFDMGLSRTLTKLVSERVDHDTNHEIPAIVWTALSIMLILGIIGGAAFGWLSKWIVQIVLKIPENLYYETTQAFYIVGFIIPFVILASGFRGILEAYHCFRHSNYIRIFFGTWMFIAPYIALNYSNSLIMIAAIIAAGRLIVVLWSLYICLKKDPKLNKFGFKKKYIHYLFSFGGWITVTNVISPMMVYFDRFIIGAKLDMSSVAYYTTPYDMMIKLGIVSSSISNTLFPVFSSLVKTNPEKIADSLRKGMLSILIIMFPVCLLIILLSHDVLLLWLGERFSENSTKITHYLAIGIFINSIAQLPFSLLQASGRPDLTAKLHCVEFPIYVVLLLWLLQQYGVEGVALAWVARVSIDAFFIFFLTGKYITSVRLVIIYMGILTTFMASFIFFTLHQHILTSQVTFSISATILLWLSVYKFEYAKNKNEKRMLNACR